jgi:hypothetical protein
MALTEIGSVYWGGLGGLNGFRTEEERTRQGRWEKGHLQPPLVSEFSLSHGLFARCVAVFLPRGPTTHSTGAKISLILIVNLNAIRCCVRARLIRAFGCQRLIKFSMIKFSNGNSCCTN